MSSEFLWVAQKVLEDQKKPMGPKEIIDRALKDRLFTDKIAGKTPHQTMKSKLSVDVKRRGEASLFVRTRPGKFYLRSLLASSDEIYTASPIEKPKSHENVLVFPSSEFYKRSPLQGISSSWKQIKRQLLRPDKCLHINRVEAEETDQFKQIISYIMISRNDSVLSFRRGNYNRVEDFLKGSYCVGFGGHIAQRDRTFFSEDMGLTDGTIRELNEELVLPPSDIKRLKNGEGLSCVGVINDDSSEAGRRHFAFVFQYEVSGDEEWEDPKRGEKSITKLQWLRPNEPRIPIWNFEYWSQLCLREYFPAVISTTPAYKLLHRASLAPPNILCVIGELGCGKSEATRILTERFGYTAVNTGRVLAKLLNIPPVPETPRETFQREAWNYISKDKGSEKLARQVWVEIEKSDNERILIDGIRHRSTLSNLRHNAGKRRIGVLYVYTLPDVAYDFFEQRERRDISFFDFLSLRAAPAEREVGELLGQADGVLYNWAGLADYRRTIAAMARDFLSNDR
jgi:predicted NUDIX family phosphoesterase/dephospho-CoA kinase